jgi:hypothetical protein
MNNLRFLSPRHWTQIRHYDRHRQALLTVVALLLFTACSVVKRNEGRMSRLDQEGGGPISRPVTIIGSTDAVPPPSLGSPTSVYPSFPPRFDIWSESEAICICLWEGDFWLPGYKAEQLAEYLGEHIEIAVDNQPIAPSELQAFSTWDLYSLGPFGSYRGRLQYCFNTLELETGSHAVRVQIHAPSNNIYSHSWEFLIGES